jgi:hypothetical protein
VVNPRRANAAIGTVVQSFDDFLATPVSSNIRYFSAEK